MPKYLKILADPGKTLDLARYSNQKALYNRLASYADSDGRVKLPAHYQKSTTRVPTKSENTLLHGMLIDMFAGGELDFTPIKNLAAWDVAERKGMSVLLQLRKKKLVEWVEPPARERVRRIFFLRDWGMHSKLSEEVGGTRYISEEICRMARDVWIEHFGDRLVDHLEVFATLAKIPFVNPTISFIETMAELVSHEVGFLERIHYGNDPLMRIAAMMRIRELVDKDPNLVLTSKTLVYRIPKK